jgi:hypothetical protein
MRGWVAAWERCMLAECRKMDPVTRGNCAALQGASGSKILHFVLASGKPVLQYSNFVGSAQQLLCFV